MRPLTGLMHRKKNNNNQNDSLRRRNRNVNEQSVLICTEAADGTFVFWCVYVFVYVYVLRSCCEALLLLDMR